MLSRTRCAHCKEKLSEEEKSKGAPLHQKCFMPYAEAFAAKRAKRREKAMRDKAAQERKDIRARKEKLEGVRKLTPKAQKAFNEYIRRRDQALGVPCISCGRTLDWSGNDVDAGHWRSVGAAKHLRFNEHNCHAQCKHCNHRLAGNNVQYRLGLIERIGLEAVEALESDNEVHKWTREELIEITKTYRAKAKALKSTSEHSPILGD